MIYSWGSTTTTALWAPAQDEAKGCSWAQRADVVKLLPPPDPWTAREGLGVTA